MVGVGCGKHNQSEGNEFSEKAGETTLIKLEVSEVIYLCRVSMGSLGKPTALSIWE